MGNASLHFFVVLRTSHSVLTQTQIVQPTTDMRRLTTGIHSASLGDIVVVRTSQSILTQTQIVQPTTDMCRLTTGIHSASLGDFVVVRTSQGLLTQTQISIAYYRYASLNDGDSFWVMRRQATSWLCDSHRGYLQNLYNIFYYRYASLNDGDTFFFVRRIRRCANVIQGTYRNPVSIAYYR